MVSDIIYVLLLFVALLAVLLLFVALLALIRIIVAYRSQSLITTRTITAEILLWVVVIGLITLITLRLGMLLGGLPIR